MKGREREREGGRERVGVRGRKGERILYIGWS